MPFSVEKETVIRYNKIDNKNCENFTKGYPFVFVTVIRNKKTVYRKENNAEKCEVHTFRMVINKEDL